MFNEFPYWRYFQLGLEILAAENQRIFIRLTDRAAKRLELSKPILNISVNAINSFTHDFDQFTVGLTFGGVHKTLSIRYTEVDCIYSPDASGYCIFPVNSIPATIVVRSPLGIQEKAPERPKTVKDKSKDSKVVSIDFNKGK